CGVSTPVTRMFFPSSSTLHSSRGIWCTYTRSRIHGRGRFWPPAGRAPSSTFLRPSCAAPAFLLGLTERVKKAYQSFRSTGPGLGGAFPLPPPGAKEESVAQRKYPLADELDRDTLLKMYRQLVLIRRFEERCAQQYSLQK